ncbi:MAG TPA: glycosyltransferase [Acidimicrobiales bacterium]|nr:glycosyltransferase [Acidimicrobiales bacterium]
MATGISIVIPARDEGETVAAVVKCAFAGAPDAEVVVVDDGSSDATASEAERAGARVIPSLGRGKGAALWTGVRDTSGDVVLFLDGDVTNPRAETSASLVHALTADPSLMMVRAAYERPLGNQPGEGGRVTELTARPALALLFPTLAHLRQPLAGEVAVRRVALERVTFVDGYGVDVGLLLDIATRYGADAIGEVSIAARAHRNRPMHQLKPMAVEVLRVILNRAGVPTAGPAPHERAPIVTDPLTPEA